MRVLIGVAYDGTNFNGWQIQPSLKTVEGEITRAVRCISGESTAVVGSGRTDAGVHALAQTAHFDIKKDFDIKKIPNALNFYLSDDVRVLWAKKVSDDFHARKSVKRKTYIYKMYLSALDNPLLKNRELRVEGVNINLIKQAAGLFVGTHDFCAFMSSGSNVKSTVRQVYDCKVAVRVKSIVLKISANGFLYNMVRKITAAVIAVGQGKKSLDDIKCALTKPYPRIKEIAPPYGLYLYAVKY